MKYLITGGCGFLGSNISNQLLIQGSEVIIYDNLSKSNSDQNLRWLQSKGNFKFVCGDVSDSESLSTIIKKEQPDVAYHLAGQVAMTTSIINPRVDFETNVLGSFNLLEAVRLFSPQTAVIYSSTNKVYGDLEQFSYEESETRYHCPRFPNGFSEEIGIEFHSPYGCSKGAADQYMLDYARIFGIKTIVFRHSSMYGSRQYGTYDQGWVSWFTQKAVETQSTPSCSFTISGTGKQVRDLLHGDDMVTLYVNAPQYIDEAQGQAFNIGGGMKNSLSLLELIELLENELDVSLNYHSIEPRISDQKVFVADLFKTLKTFDWSPKVDNITGIRRTISWIKAINL
jgi:CDP-paratose 2-epimerase